MVTQRDFWILMIVGALLLLPGCDPATDNGDPTTHVLPETYRIAVPATLSNEDPTEPAAAVRGIRAVIEEDLANYATQNEATGQGIVRVAISEIDQRTSKVSMLLALMAEALAGLEGATDEWVTGKEVAVSAEAFAQIEQIEGEPPDGLAIGDDYAIPPFLYAEEADFGTLFDYLDGQTPADAQALTFNTNGFAQMIVLNMLATEGGEPELGDHFDLLFILWTDDNDDARIASLNRTNMGESFLVQYDYDATALQASIFYSYVYYADWETMTDPSLTDVVATIKSVDQATNGVLITFGCHAVRGDVGHEYEYFIRGYADDSAGYTQFLSRYNPNVGSATYTAGLQGLGRYREQFDDTAEITGVLRFDRDSAESIDSWFSAPDDGEWDEAQAQTAAFAENDGYALAANVAGYHGYYLDGRDAINVEIPAGLTFADTEFDKLFVITAADSDPTDWSTVVGHLVVAREEYESADGALVQIAHLYGIDGVAQTYDIHEVTAASESAIEAVTTTRISVDTTTGIYSAD